MTVARRPAKAHLDSFQYLGLFGAVAYAAVALLPWWGGDLALCPWKFRTGWPCPACGVTTCFSEVLRGRIPSACLASPLGVLLTAAVLWALADLALARLFNRNPYRLRCSSGEKAACVLACAALVLLNWLYLASSATPA